MFAGRLQLPNSYSEISPSGSDNRTTHTLEKYFLTTRDGNILTQAFGLRYATPDSEIETDGATVECCFHA